MEALKYETGQSKLNLSHNPGLGFGVGVEEMIFESIQEAQVMDKVDSSRVRYSLVSLKQGNGSFRAIALIRTRISRHSWPAGSFYQQAAEICTRLTPAPCLQINEPGSLALPLKQAIVTDRSGFWQLA